MRLGEYDFILSNEQSIGRRSRQEDYFGTWMEERDEGTIESALLVVSDGMGGLDGGDAASVAALHRFIEIMRESDLPIFERFQAAAVQANREVYEMAVEAGRDVGCTLVALYLTPNTYQWISIGDSVLYLGRGGALTRLNRDHNLGTQLDEQLAAGEITAAYAESRAAERSHLTSGLGLEEIPEMDISDPFPLEAGDGFVLATDGLTNTLQSEEIERIVVGGDRHDTAALLVRSVLEAGNEKQDNITVVALTVEGVTEAEEAESGNHG